MVDKRFDSRPKQKNIQVRQHLRKTKSGLPYEVRAYLRRAPWGRGGWTSAYNNHRPFRLESNDWRYEGAITLKDLEPVLNAELEALGPEYSLVKMHETDGGKYALVTITVDEKAEGEEYGAVVGRVLGSRYMDYMGGGKGKVVYQVHNHSERSIYTHLFEYKPDVERFREAGMKTETEEFIERHPPIE